MKKNWKYMSLLAVSLFTVGIVCTGWDSLGEMMMITEEAYEEG